MSGPKPVKRSALALVLGQARAIVAEKFGTHDRCPEGTFVYADQPSACLHCAIVIAGGGDWRLTSQAVTTVRETLRRPEWPAWLQPNLSSQQADAWHRLTGARLDTRAGALSVVDAAIASLEAP